MSDDIVEKLRNWAAESSGLDAPFDEAADEIERLRAQTAALREALQWYVDNDNTNEGGDWDRVSSFWREGRNRARAALEEK